MRKRVLPQMAEFMLDRVLMGITAALLYAAVNCFGQAQAEAIVKPSDCQIITDKNAVSCCRTITRTNIDACTGRPCDGRSRALIGERRPSEATQRRSCARALDFHGFV